MDYVWWNNCHHSRYGDLSDTVYRDLKLARQYYPHLFLGMGMLMNGSAVVELPVAEGWRPRQPLSSSRCLLVV
jgi:hypothetical protein